MTVGYEIVENELKKFIENPASGMLLDADDLWKSRNPSAESFDSMSDSKGAAFELVSGRYQKKFITLWELFDHPEEFKQCLEALAQKAREIRTGGRYFSTVVTSSPTSRYLMEHLHARIEDDQDPVAVHYLGHYPFLNAQDRGLFDLENEKVLILTDVVASGTMIRRLASTIEQLGGTVIGALSLIRLLEKDQIPAIVDGTNCDSGLHKQEQIHTDELNEAEQELVKGESISLPENEKYGSHHRVRVFHLLDYECSRIERGSFDPKKVIRIDPQTVYPEERHEPYDRDGTLIRGKEAIQLLEESLAIDFGFYQEGSSRFLHAVRCDRLLALGEGVCRPSSDDENNPQKYFGKAQIIWEKIHDYLTDPTWRIVCSYSSADLEFRKFVRDQIVYSASTKTEQEEKIAEDRARSYFLFQRDDGTEDDDYFIAERRRKELKNKKVVLLTGVVHSGERLRKLIGVLASYGVSELRVICLINGMGILTEDFISRIKSLLRGVNGERDKGPEVKFKFLPIFTFDDLPSDRAERVFSGALSLLERYRATTSVPSFQRWVNQTTKYFKTASVTSRQFVTDYLHELPLSVNLNYDGNDVRASFRETKLFVLLSNLLRDENRSYTALFNEMRTESDKSTLYKLFALFVGDISFIRMTEQDELLRDTILERISECRTRRLQIERATCSDDIDLLESQTNEIKEIIDTEAYMMFGLALISYLDRKTPQFDHQRIILELLMPDSSISASWSDYPHNTQVYLADERVAWCLSMVIHFTHPQIKHARRRSGAGDSGVIQPEMSTFEFRESIRVAISEHLAELKPRLHSDATSGAESERLLRIKQNLDSLLDDLGFHSLDKKHQIIRYLHSQLLGPKSNHNPVATTLNALLSKLDVVVFREHNKERVDIRKLPKIRGEQLQQLLEDAIYSIGILQNIANTLQVFFVFAPLDNETAKQVKAGGLSTRIEQLGDLLERIRVSNHISRENHKQINDAIIELSTVLFSPGSPVQRALGNFVCPLKSILDAAFDAAVNRLADFGLDNCWLDAWDRMKGKLCEIPIFRIESGEDKKRLEKFEEVGKLTNSDDLLCLFDRPGLLEVIRNILTNGRHAWLPEITTVANPPVDCTGKSNFDVRILQEIASEEETGYTEFVELRFRTFGKIMDKEWSDNGNGTLVRQRLAVEAYGGEMKVTPLQDRSGTEIVLRLISRRELSFRPSSSSPNPS